MSSTEKRKDQHIDICLEQNVESTMTSNGLDRYHFLHQALPEIDFQDVTLQTAWLGKIVRTPFLISSMTGGTKRAGEINRVLARAAEERGWSMGLGSARVAIEHIDALKTFQVREVAPSIPIVVNIGAVQLNYGFGVHECRRVVEQTEADALVFHLNSLQEVFQPEGDTNFSELLGKIEKVTKELTVPVGVKEVGWGIHGHVAKQLYHAGVQFIDVAGAGGTSWSQVEKYRHQDPFIFDIAKTFAEWGVPTSYCIQSIVQEGLNTTVIASGGMRTGLDAAKAIALGADLAGFGRSLLAAAVDSEQAIMAQLSRIEHECRIAMFGIGAQDVMELKNSHLLIRKSELS